MTTAIEAAGLSAGDLSTAVGGPLGDEGMGAIVVGVSKDPNAKLSILLVPRGGHSPAYCLKVPTTAAAERAVRAEARALQALDRIGLGPAASTIPRVVGEPVVAGRRGVLLSGLPGTPLASSYHRWRHTADRAAVGVELDGVGRWLRTFWDATARGRATLDPLADVIPALATRFAHDPRVGGVVSELTEVRAGLRAVSVRLAAVHGDFWFGNVLMDGSRVTGVVDWEAGAVVGDPTRDVIRFALAYALYLDRHTRPGRAVAGHRGLRAGVFGSGIEHMLDGHGWFPDLARAFIAGGLADVGVPSTCWRGLALAGIAEVAASADHDGFATAHLGLLARLLGRGGT